MRYILQRPTWNTEVYLIERGSIITYIRNFGFDNEKKFFKDKLMSEKKKKKNGEDGRFMSYRHVE